MLLAVGLSRCLACADGPTNDPARLRIVRHGSYTYTCMVTSNRVIYVNPSEFWPGTWKEDANGWRVQLCIYPQTNFWVPQERVVYPVSTNLMLSVEWGSAVKNTGGGYYMTPNGKFARFELLDARGNVVPPNPNAGTNLLARCLEGRSFTSVGDISQNPTCETHLPAWASPTSGSLVASFPKTISTNVYPHLKYGGIVGQIGSATNFPPFCVGLLKLDEIYSVTKEGDYALTVQPVLYKQRNQPDAATLDRVDLPSVTTKVHLVPKAK